MLLGHEGAGTVESVGDGRRRGSSAGDRVVLGWKTACGTCATVPCAGEPRRCKKPPAAPGRLFRAGGDELTPVLRTGTFATHTVVPPVAAVKVPRELPVEQACLIGCAVATGVMSVLETAKVWEGARVAVIGCGAVGLSVIQGACLCLDSSSSPCSLTAGVAVVVGAGSLRVRGLMLAVTTFVFAVAVQQYFYRQPLLSGGSASLASFPRGRSSVSTSPHSARTTGQFWRCSSSRSASLSHLRRSGIGRTTIAVRDNADSAAAYTVGSTADKAAGLCARRWARRPGRRVDRGRSRVGAVHRALLPRR